MKANVLQQAWLVLILAVVFGGGLAGVESTLKPRILENRLRETIDQVPFLVPGSVDAVKDSLGGRVVYRAQDSRGETLGWVFPTSGQGFADRIEILLAVNGDASRITGVYVLDQKETPGLGNKIVNPDWRAQFQDKATQKRFVVTKTSPARPEEIHGITGATISSETVVDIVNRASRELKGALAERRREDT
jgi:electron transport complex protein RnfG